MANSNFVVQNGLTIGPLTIDAATGSITTTGNITTTGTTTTFINEIVTGTEAVYGVLSANAGVASTSTTTGTFVVTGGIGVSGAIYNGGVHVSAGNVVAASGTSSSNTTTGALVVVGGAGVSGAVYAGSVYDNGNRVLTSLSSSGAGNVTVSVSAPASTTIALPATGPGATSAGSSTAIPVITTDAYGRVSALTTAAVVAPAGTLSGSTLASGVTASSLTSVGTLTSLSTGAITTTGTLALNAAGGITTNQATFPLVNATATTINFGGAATSINLGASSGASILPTASNVTNIGSTSLWFAGVYAQNFYGTSTTAKYADLAENYQADNTYLPGQVLEFGGTAEVTLATPDTKRVAGVVSTNPAHLMNGGLTGPNVMPLALQGRVPCNVIGPVAKGDLMVSAGFGYAKTNNDAHPGQIIGKALADFGGAKGQIEVVVGRL